MHNLKYQEFIQLIKSLSTIKCDNQHIKTLQNLSFTEALLLCIQDYVIKADLKTFIMNENKISIKISKSYLKSPSLYYKQESVSIMNQLNEIYQRDYIRLVDLAYLQIFFESAFYEELLHRLDFVSCKQHHMYQDFEDVFYRSLKIEGILSSTNLEDLYKNLTECQIYNIEIHKYIHSILKNAENQLHKIYYYKKLIVILEEKSILYTTEESDLDSYKEKIYSFELILYTRIIIQKYGLSKSLLQVENLASNMVVIISVFKKEFHRTKNIKEQIELMKNFTVFLPFVQFAESTLAERLKVYDYVFSILQIELNDIHHIKEVIRCSNELLEVFFFKDKNVFIDNLRSKIYELQAKLDNFKGSEQENYLYIINIKLITAKSVKLELFSDSKFDQILDSYRESKYKDVYKKVKQIKNALQVFVSITNEIDDPDFNLFCNEINSIFEIIKKIINVKIKYFVHIGIEEDLKSSIHDLQCKYFQHKLFILKFLDGKFKSRRDVLTKDRHLCKNHQIADAYLKEVINSKKINLCIEDVNDVGKILDIIPQIFFDKSLFYDTGEFIIDELVKYYDTVQNIILKINTFSSDDDNLNNDIKKMVKIYKHRVLITKTLKKTITSLIKVKINQNVDHIKDRLLKFYDDNIQKVKESVLENYELSVNIWKISKYVLKRKLNYNLPEVSLNLDLQNRITIFKNTFTVELVNKDEFIGFYEDTKTKYDFRLICVS